MVVMSRSVRVGAVAAALVGLLALTACSSSGASSGSGAGLAAHGKLTIVTSFYPLAYLAERIGGDRVSVTNLASGGVGNPFAAVAPQRGQQFLDEHRTVERLDADITPAEWGAFDGGLIAGVAGCEGGRIGWRVGERGRFARVGGGNGDRSRLGSRTC